MQLAAGEEVRLKWGASMKIAWDPHPGPPAPPPAPPSPPGGAPGRIGEGGSAYALGDSNVVVMLHYGDIYRSGDGGRNLTWQGLPPGSNAHSSDLCYLRAAGSRTEPAGPLFTVMFLPSAGNGAESEGEGEYTLEYAANGELRDGRKQSQESSRTAMLLKSPNLGKSWTWSKFPPQLQQAVHVATSPDDPNTLYAVAPDCIATSADLGATWSGCWHSVNFTGAGFTSLIIRDSKTMLAVRSGADVPLRTLDGGRTWVALEGLKNQSAGTSFSGSYSWSGKTLVVWGRDLAALAQGRAPTFVLSTKDDGDTWRDEGQGVVTASPASGSWYGDDFYLSSAGEGIMVKRGLEGRA